MAFLKKSSHRKEEMKKEKPAKKPSRLGLMVHCGFIILYHFILFSGDYTEKAEEEFHKFEEIEKEAEKAIQHRARLLQEIGSLHKLRSATKFTPEEESLLKELEEQSSQLKQKYWDCRTERFNMETKGGNSMIRATASVNKTVKRKYKRRNIPWTVGMGVGMCGEYGGCCGRGCGCCKKPRATLLPGDPIYSHCTSECGCCLEYLKAP